MEDLFSITFAGNDLSAIAGVEVYNHTFDSLPSRDIKINKLARQDLSIITSSEYSAKTISVDVKIAGTSHTATESLITQLKSRVQSQNAPLVASQGGIKVEYTATLNEFTINWVNGFTALVTLGFIASDPVGRGVLTQNLAVYNGSTTAIRALSVTIEGSAVAKPSITVVVNSVTGGTAASISITNGATTQGLTVTRTWTAGDVLIVDSANMQATVNGIVTDFSGMFPVYNAGAQQIKYNDSFTTRNVDISATYKPRLV